MTNEAAQELLNFLLPDMRYEFAVTRKVLAAVPAGTCHYKPSEKCMTGLQLAAHIATAEAFFLQAVVNGKFEMKPPPELADPAAVLAFYDQTIPALQAQVAALSPEQLAQPIVFHGMMNEPAVKYLMLNLKHVVHHRGQLSSYLRPMGAKVPSIYGGSADEPIEAAAAH